MTGIRQAKMMALSAAAGVVVGAGITLTVMRHRRRNKAKRFLPRRARKAIMQVLELAGDEVVPGGPIGESVYRHRLSKLSDKNLLALYAAAKVGEYMREAGIDPLHASAEQVARIRDRFADIQATVPQDRIGMLDGLMFLDRSDARDMLESVLGLLARA